MKDLQFALYAYFFCFATIIHKTNTTCQQIKLTYSNTYKRSSEVHSMRYFFRPELESYLEKAGFELIDNLDCATLEATDYDSWTSYFVARAV